jgi:hypothetical protein
MALSINEGLALSKAVGSRLAELKELRDKVAVKSETTWIGMGDRDKKQTVEALFDVKKVDKKITELSLFLFKIDAAIKQANAVTKLEISADVETLLAPLE